MHHPSFFNGTGKFTRWRNCPRWENIIKIRVTASQRFYFYLRMTKCLNIFNILMVLTNRRWRSDALLSASTRCTWLVLDHTTWRLMYRFCEHNCSQARCMMDVNWTSQTYYYMDTQLNVTQDNDEARWTGPKQNACWISHDVPNIMLHGDTVWVLHNEQRWESTQNKMHDGYLTKIPNTMLHGDSFNSAKICCNFAYRSGSANRYCCILHSP